MAGLGLWLLVVLARVLMEGRGFEADTLETIETVLTYAQGLAYALFGVGIVHKAVAAEPPKKQGANT